MLNLARHILVLLIAVAVIGGTNMELVRSAHHVSPMMIARMPCDMAMQVSAAGDSKTMPPCKGMTQDCIKLMGCVTIPALPARFLTQEITVQDSAVAYWPESSRLASLDHTPEPLPPRTI